jgi:hypothetical protein
VSRWSADPLRIALAPGEAALRLGSEQRLVAGLDRTAASLLPPLDEALADARWQGRRVEVVLSQHFVHHVLTPPPGTALSAAEERALVGAALHEIYGDEAAGWAVQVHSQPPHHGLLGAAVDAALIEQLDALLARHGFRQIRILPLASVAARRLPRKIEGWWALVEPGWLSLFGASEGYWQHTSAHPIDTTWARALPELIAREAQLQTLPSVWIQALGLGPVSIPEHEAAHWQVLPHGTEARGVLGWVGV